MAASQWPLMQKSSCGLHSGVDIDHDEGSVSTTLSARPRVVPAQVERIVGDAVVHELLPVPGWSSGGGSERVRK